jgi:hypothetical protein
MNRTTTVIAALIAAAGLSTMVYAVPEQRALAWFGGFGGGCGYGRGGGVFVHKTIIQTINQVNNCTGNTHGALQMDDDHTNQDHNQKDKQTICLNTAVNSAGRGVGNSVPDLG